MKKVKLTSLLSLLLVMALTFTACGGDEKKEEAKDDEKKTEASDESKDDEAEKTDEESKKEASEEESEEATVELKPIKIILDWVPNTNHTGLYVAKEKGLFEEVGFDVEIMQPPEGSTTQLIGSGGGELGISFQDTLAQNFSSKTPLPVTAVATILQHNTSGILSLKDKEIDSPKKMNGKKYSTWDSPIELAIIEKMMADDGGDFTELELVPYSENLLAFLQEGADCAWIFYAWDGILFETEGMETNFIAVKDFLPDADYYTPVIIANNEWLEKNPEDAKKIMAAISEGYEFAAENPKEAAEYLLKNAPELSEELALASQEWISKEYISDGKQFGYIEPVRWNAFYAWLFKAGLIENEIPEDFGFSNDYLPER